MDSFSCDYCGKKFASGSNLKRHLQIHQDGRQNFECIFDKSYLHKSSLKRHYLESHKAEYEELLAQQDISRGQIKENPLTHGVAVGKRGSPRTSDRVSSGKPPSKRRKTEVDASEGKETK